jgi:exosome complex component RRP45
VDEKIEQTLSLAHIPIAITVALTENNLIADPSGTEELVAKSRLTISMNVYKEICNIHKPGGMSISEETLSGCVKLAEQRIKETTEWMRTMVKERPQFSASFD